MKKRWIWTWLILFSLALVSSVDLLNNYLQALLPQDGITCTSVVYRLLHGDDGWSCASFLDAATTSMWITACLGLAGLWLAAAKKK